MNKLCNTSLTCCKSKESLSESVSSSAPARTSSSAGMPFRATGVLSSWSDCTKLSSVKTELEKEPKCADEKLESGASFQGLLPELIFPKHCQFVYLTTHILEGHALEIL